jgi:hypothetical protein
LLLATGCVTILSSAPNVTEVKVDPPRNRGAQGRSIDRYKLTVFQAFGAPDLALRMALNRLSSDLLRASQGFS